MLYHPCMKIVTMQGQDELALEALKAGETLFFVKGLADLSPGLRRRLKNQGYTIHASSASKPETIEGNILGRKVWATAP